MTALAHPLVAAFRRWPALYRAAVHGLSVQIAPGVAARLQLVVQGDRVFLPVQLPQTTVRTMFGDVTIQGQCLAQMNVDDAGRALAAAEAAGVMPRIDELLRASQGRPLLNLPYAGG